MTAVNDQVAHQLPTTFVPDHLHRLAVRLAVVSEFPYLRQEHHVTNDGQWLMHTYYDTTTGASVKACRHRTNRRFDQVAGNAELWCRIRVTAALCEVTPPR